MPGVYVTVGSTTWLDGNKLFIYMTPPTGGQSGKTLGGSDRRAIWESGETVKRVASVATGNCATLVGSNPTFPTK